LILLVLAVIVSGGILSYLGYFKREIELLTKFPEIKKPEKVVEEEIIRSLIQEFYEILEQRKNAKSIMTFFTSPQTPEEKESYDWLIGTDIGAPRLFMRVKISNPSIKEIQKIEEKEFRVIATDQFQSWSNVVAQWSDPIDRDVYFIVVKVGDKWLIDKYVDANPNILYRTEKYSGFGYEEITADLTNWKTYRNEEYGFEIKYPKNWNIEEEKEFPDFFGIIFMNAGEEIGLMIYREPSDIKAKAALDKWLEAAREQKAEIKEISIGFKKGYKAVQPFDISAAVVKGQHLYWFLTLSLEESFFDQILSTFRFLE